LGASLALARGPMGARDADFQTAVAQAYSRYKADRSGKVTSSVPALASASPDLYAVVIVRVDGKVFEAGDAATAFVLDSLSAPFTAALVAEQQGTDVLTGTLGAVAGTAPTPSARTTADWGNAPATALEAEGAIPTLSLVQPKGDADGKWRALLTNLSNFAGNELTLDERVYQSATGNSDRLKSLIKDLSGEGRLLDDPQQTADLYLRQNSVAVTTFELALMAATLANDGVNPIDGRRAVSAATARSTQALITNAGLRGAKKQWMTEAGAGAASGLSGGAILVMPGRLGIAIYSPPLDSKGISVRGQRAMRYLTQVLMIGPDPTKP
jgi:glutaminase